MDEKEVKIGENIIGENTKVTLTIKMALWIIGGIIFLFSTAFTYTYIDVKKEVKACKAQAEKDKSDFIMAVEAKLDEKLGTFQKQDEQFIREIESIKGDVKVILDRTSGIRSSDNTIYNSKNNRPPK